MSNPNSSCGARNSAAEDAENRRQLQKLAWLLDSAIRLPGGFRIGIDALLGVIPFLGDAAGVALSGYIVVQAARLGAPPSVLLRMALNVAVEGAIGLVPVAGDVFDAAWKANQRNVRLLERHLGSPASAAGTSRRLLAMLLAAWIAFMVVTTALAALFVNGLWNAL